jgi:hypothetical protein
MEFYYILFTIILLLALLGDVSRRIKIFGNNTVFYRIALFSISMFLIVIMSIRYEVGTDYTAYIHQAKHMLSIPFEEAIIQYELFYILFSKISFSLFDSMQFFYLIIAILIIVPFALSIRHSDESLFYVFLFFFVTTVFFISMNAMRQMAAFSISLYALKYLRNKSFFFLLYVVFASLWHTSALIYLSLYFLDKINLDRIYILVLISFVVFKSVLNVLILSFIERTGLPMEFYFAAQKEASSKMFIIISVIIFFLFKFFVIRKGDNANLLYNISLINVGVAIFADGIPGAFRLVYMFYPFYCFISPFMIRNSRIKQKNVMAIVLFSLFAIYFYRQQILGNANEIIPYKTIFM